MPPFLSKKFVHFGEAADPDQAAAMILESGPEVAAEFFIECTDYTSWIKEEGAELMAKLVEFFSNEWIHYRLEAEQAESIVKALWNIFPLIESHLTKSVTFVAEGEAHQEFPLPFVTLSTELSEIVRGSSNLSRPLEVPTITPQQFKFVREYAYSGDVEYLWREEPEAIVDMIRLASDMGMKGLAQLAARTYRRYLTEENVVEHLEKASLMYLKPLEEECCQFISDHALGINLERSELFGLFLEVEWIREEFQPLLVRVAKDVTHLKLKGTAGSDSFLLSLLPSMKKLVRVDVGEARGLSEELVEEFPVVSEWLFNCAEWLDDTLFERLIPRAKKVSRLEISAVGDLTEASLSQLSRLPWLTKLNISDMHGISNDVIELIACAAPMLTELTFQHSHIGDPGLIALGEHCTELRILDLTRGNFTNEGIILFSEKAKNLERWILKDGRGFDEEGLQMAFRQMPGLQFVDLSGCRVSRYFEEEWKLILA